jgi:hypothetical protein
VPPIRYQGKHRVFRDRHSAARSGRPCSPHRERISRTLPWPGAPACVAREENGDEPFITGEEKALKRRPGRVIALPRLKGWSE